MEVFLSKNLSLEINDRLSYFNKSSMSNLIQDLGFQIKMIVAENPMLLKNLLFKLLQRLPRHYL